MQRLALLTLLSAGFMLSAAAQEEPESAEEATVAEEGEAATNENNEAEADPADDADENLDESVLDDEFYQDADDEDFRPSEDVPADQAIPFPTDI